MDENSLNKEESSMVVKESSKGGKGPLVAIIIVIVLILGIGGYILISGNTSGNSTSAATPTIALKTQGSSDNSGTSVPTGVQTSPAQTKQLTVAGSEFAYSPSVLNVNQGDTVQITFKNNGTFPHNLVISDLGVSTKTINPGETDTVQFTANQTGNFAFYCSVDSHKDKGMQGSLIVK